MSRIAIISDIHGNIYALDAVLKDIDQQGVRIIYCLGDLVGYYCFFNEVVARIQQLYIPTLLGNHDEALVFRKGVIDRSRTCTNILRWQLQHAAPETLNFLKDLPDQMDFNFAGRSFQAVHAGLENKIDEYLFDVTDEYLAKNKFEKDILLTGHTHLLNCKRFYSGKMWLNPGSVGQPRDFDNRAGYLLIDEELNIEFRKVSYNFLAIAEAMAANGFDSYISDALISGKKIGL